MDADIGVIGIGTMGSMALWQLAKRGISVIGFEQFGIGHDRSAAGGDTRIFRTAYAESPEYVPLLQEAHRLWLELEQETNRQLLTMTNGLTIGNTHSESFQNVIKSIKDFKLNHEILNQEEMKQQFPQHHLLPDDLTVLDKQAGFLRPEYAIVTAAERAVQLGAKIHKYTYVENIQPNRDHIIIQANDREYKVRQLLITTGPWAGELLPKLKEHLKARQVISTWFPAKDPSLFSPEKFPVFIRRVGDDKFYGIPSVDGRMVKVVFSGSSEDELESPSLNNRDTNLEFKRISKISEIVQKYLPGLHQDPARVGVYMEGFTRDLHSIVGKVPGHKNIVLLCGFSGHGFKMAPTMGQIATDLLLNNNTRFSIDHLSPTRFFKKMVI